MTNGNDQSLTDDNEEDSSLLQNISDLEQINIHNFRQNISIEKVDNEGTNIISNYFADSSTLDIIDDENRNISNNNFITNNRTDPTNPFLMTDPLYNPDDHSVMNEKFYYVDYLRKCAETEYYEGSKSNHSLMFEDRIDMEKFSGIDVIKYVGTGENYRKRWRTIFSLL